MPAAQQRIALVTGANKGIGLEIARQIGKLGHIVLLGARDAARGNSAAGALNGEGIDARFVHLDLADPDSISAAARAIEAHHGRLDTLVNNAGIGDRADGPPGKASMDAVRRVFDTNFFGSLSVTQAMLPLLQKSSAARIVNVSSGLGSLTHNGDRARELAAVRFIGYNASKAALNMLTVQLAAEFAGTRIKVNSADPGLTATDLTGHRGQTIAQGAAAAVRLALLPDDGPSGGFFSAARAEPW